MEEILQSIKAYLYDRASSPLIGAFITSWAVWNYKIILIILSGEDYIFKFDDISTVINEYACTLPWTNITVGFYSGSGIIFPLLTALAYIYIYPFAAEPVYRYSLNKQKNINTLKKQANNSRIIDEKESRKLFKDLADMQSKYDLDVNQYQKQVESLKSIIDEFNEERINSINQKDFSQLSNEDLDEIVAQYGLIKDIKEIKETSEPALNENIQTLDERHNIDSRETDNENDAIDHAILKKIYSASSNAHAVSSLSRNSNFKMSDVHASLKRLSSQGFIKESHVTDKNEQAYTFTVKGNDYLIKNGFLD